MSEAGVLVPELIVRRRPPWAGLWAFARRHPLGAAGGLIVLAMALLAILAPWAAPREPLAMSLSERLTPPGTKFLLGSDNYGRDVLSRIIWGAQISLYVGLLSVVMGTTVGAFLGLISGFWGGTLDTLVQRFMDVLMTFPMLVLALCIMAVLGTSLNNVVIAIAVTQVPRTARVLRSSALAVARTEYVSAARAIGCRDWRILFLHVLPNCLAPFIILGTAGLGWAIVVEASLSFLGMGVPPPAPSWGGMLSGMGREYAATAPWLAVFPGVALSLAVFGFNLLGDAIRDAWDPRLRGS
ncbi:MAG: ABC transporter permease [Chloroflexi bacterium]|nr:ABC transporter permease [Chloroflexota bacterium]